MKRESKKPHQAHYSKATQKEKTPRWCETWRQLETCSLSSPPWESLCRSAECGQLFQCPPAACSICDVRSKNVKNIIYRKIRKVYSEVAIWGQSVCQVQVSCHCLASWIASVIYSKTWFCRSSLTTSCIICTNMHCSRLRPSKDAANSCHDSRGPVPCCCSASQ